MIERLHGSSRRAMRSYWSSSKIAKVHHLARHATPLTSSKLRSLSSNTFHTKTEPNNRRENTNDRRSP